MKIKSSFEKLKNLKITSALFLLSVFAIMAAFFNTSFQQVVLAVTGSYSKSPNDKITADDWNNLSNDFMEESEVDAKVNAVDFMDEEEVENKISEQMGSKKYTAVMVLNDSGTCPKGYTEESVEDLAGSNNYVFLRLQSHGLFIGADISQSYDREYIKSQFHRTNIGVEKICSKTFNSVSKPHASFFMIKNDDPSLCPTGYSYHPYSSLRRKDWDSAYLLSTDAGFALGALDNQGANSTSYENGYIRRSFQSNQVGGVCYRVMGVNEDAETKTGVFPVFLGVKDSSVCSDLGSDWKNIRASDITNETIYINWNDNMSVAGGMNNWDYGGENYAYAYFSNNKVNNLCFKYFSSYGEAYTQVRLLDGSGKSCQSGYLSIDAAQVKGSDNHGYLQKTSHGLYIGGLDSWGRDEQKDGWITNNWTNNLNKICLKLENVSN